MREFANAQGCHRSLLGGFDQNRVAARQCRPNFPCQHHQWKIPRQYTGNHTQGFAHDHADSISIGRGHLIIQLVDRFRVPADCADGFGQIGHHAFADRLAAFEAFQNRQFVQIFLNQISQLQQNGLALARTLGRPHARVKRSAGQGYRVVNIRGITGINIGNHVARRRVDGFHRLASVWFLVATVDKWLHRKRDRLCYCNIFFFGQQL